MSRGVRFFYQSFNKSSENVKITNYVNEIKVKRRN